MLSDIGFLFDKFQLGSIWYEMHPWKDVTILLKNVDYRREEHDVELSAGLDAGGSW